MSPGIGKTLTAAILLAIIVSGIFISLLSLSEGAFGPHVYRYRDASAVSPSKSEIELLLATLGRTMNSSDVGLLRAKLASVVQLSPENGLISDYTTALFDLSGNLTGIEHQLVAARSSLISGNRGQAVAIVGELEQEREQSSTLMQSSRSLLMQIGQRYQIDTASEASRLNALTQLYNEYSATINQLASEVETQTILIQTNLTLNSSAGVAFIGQSIRVSGNLETANGTALENKTITISWDSSHVVLESGVFGYFEANVSFPAGSQAGLITIMADYKPSAVDKLMYMNSTAQIQVQLFYEPTSLRGKIGPTIVRPLGVVDVWGNLSATLDHRPLVNRTIDIHLDGTSIGNTTTDNYGGFFFYFSVPITESNGTHTVRAAFSASKDIYAPANASFQLKVEILATQTKVQVDHSMILSGTSIVINGTISYVNATLSNQVAPPSGNVTIYLDNVAYGNVSLNTHSEFAYQIQLALGASYGAHSIILQYHPDKPWVQGSESTVSVNVVSVPWIVLAASVLAISSILGTVYATKRKKRKVELSRGPLMPQPIAAEDAGVSEEFSPGKLVAALEARTGIPSKVQTAYGLAQLMITKSLGIDTRASETPAEFLLRIGEIHPSLKGSLSSIVKLFELAEYSSYPLEAQDAIDATDAILKLREDLQSVKSGEDKH